MNADNGAVIATLPIGEGTDFASFDPKAAWRIAQIATGRSRSSPKNPRKFRRVAAIPTQMGARTMAIDPKTGRIYLVTASNT